MIETIQVKVEKVVTVTKYKTTPGEMFDTEPQAIEHEAKYMRHIDAKARLRAQEFYIESLDVAIDICYLEDREHAKAAFQFRDSYNTRNLVLNDDQTPGWFLKEPLTDRENDECGYSFTPFDIKAFQAELINLVSRMEAHIDSK